MSCQSSAAGRGHDQMKLRRTANGVSLTGTGTDTTLRSLEAMLEDFPSLSPEDLEVGDSL